MHNVHIHRLSNGVVSVIVPLSGATSATATVLVRTGSSHEKKSIRGISHFLEHMCFKGTVSRPSPLAIASSFERLGAVNNAFTSRDFTGYWAKVAPRHIENILELLADMYFNPLLDSRQIEKEKKVIVEEINMYEDDPDTKAALMLEEAMYGDRHAGWSVAGTKQTVCAITRQKLLAWRRTRYHGPTTVVIVAGGVHAGDIKRSIQKLFGPLGRAAVQPAGAIASGKKGIRTAVFRKKLDQTHLMLGLEAFSLYSPHRFTLGVLSEILGGGMGSRLFQRIREQMGAAYYARSHVSLFTTHGFLGVGMGVAVTKTVQALEAAVQELMRMAKEPASREELSRAKEHLLGRFYLSLETSDTIGDFYGEQVATGQRLKSPSDIERAVRGVSATAIRQLARRLTTPKTLTVAAVGPDVTHRHLTKAVGAALFS